MKCAYCPTCATETILREIGDEGPTPSCNTCGKMLFDVPTPCVLVLGMNAQDQNVLLRRPHVSKRPWVLVASYCKAAETAEQAAEREIREETGLTVGVSSDRGHDDRPGAGGELRAARPSQTLPVSRPRCHRSPAYRPYILPILPRHATWQVSKSTRDRSLAPLVVGTPVVYHHGWRHGVRGNHTLCIFRKHVLCSVRTHFQKEGPT